MSVSAFARSSCAAVLIACTMMATSAVRAEQISLSSLNSRLVKLYQAGDPDGAMRTARTLLKMTIATYGPRHVVVARAMNNVALLEDLAGRASASEAIYRDALAILEAAYGKRHPQTAVVTNNLAATLVAQCKLDEARPLYLRSANVLTADYGPEHRDAKMALGNFRRISEALGWDEPKERDARPMSGSWQLIVPQRQDFITIPAHCMS